MIGGAFQFKLVVWEGTKDICDSCISGFTDALILSGGIEYCGSHSMELSMRGSDFDRDLWRLRIGVVIRRSRLWDITSLRALGEFGADDNYHARIKVYIR